MPALLPFIETAIITLVIKTTKGYMIKQEHLSLEEILQSKAILDNNNINKDLSLLDTKEDVKMMEDNMIGISNLIVQRGKRQISMLSNIKAIIMDNNNNNMDNKCNINSHILNNNSITTNNTHHKIMDNHTNNNNQQVIVQHKVINYTDCCNYLQNNKEGISNNNSNNLLNKIREIKIDLVLWLTLISLINRNNREDEKKIDTITS